MKKLFAVLICFLLAATALLPIGTALADEAAPVKVWFSQNTFENEKLRELAREFTRETGISVEIVDRINPFNAKADLVNNAEIDGRPDIVFMQAPDIGELVISGYLMPLSLPQETLDRYVDCATDAFTMNGALYGVGYSVESYGLVYNKDIISTDELPGTWSEYFEKAGALTLRDNTGKITQYGTLLDCKDTWFNYPIIKNFGGYYYGLDDSGQYYPYDVGYNNAGMIAYCNFIKEQMTIDHVLPGQNQGASDITTYFRDGKLAMFIDGLWRANIWKDAGINYGIARLPNNDDGTPSRPLTTVNGFVINNFSLHKDSAMLFLEFLLRDNVQQSLIEAANRGELKTGLRPPANLSVINSGYVQSDPTLKGICDINLDCEPFPNIPEGTIWYNYTTTALKSIFFDGADVKAKLDELTAAILADVEKMNITPERVDLPWYSYVILAAFVLCAALVYVLIKRKKNIPLFDRAKYDKKTTLLAWLLMSPMILLLGIFYLFPIVHNIYLSLTDYSGVNLRNYGFVGFYNYKQIFEEGLSGLASMIIWTVFFAFCVVAISFVFGTFIAVLLERTKAKIARIYRLIFIFPWVVPSVITLLMWSGMLSEGGIVSQLFGGVGLLDGVWSARFWALFVMIWFSFPYYMVVAFSFLKAIPKEYYEAARVDGASNFKQFTTITLPLVFKAILPTLIMGFIMQFNQFGIYILTGGGPFVGELGSPGATDLLITYVFNLAFNSKRYALAASYSVIIFIFIAVFSIVAMRVGKASSGDE